MMIEDNEKIEQMATVISNFCDKHQYDLTEQEIDDIALDMADKGYGNVREYEKRLCDKYIEIGNLNRDYRNAFERLKSQQQEIDGLKAENEKLTKVVLSKVYDFVNKIIEETNTRLDIENQAKIDVLNELKEKYGFYSCYSFKNDVKSLSEIIDELLKEYENE